MYQLLTDDEEVNLGGFVYQDESRRVGCSPDYLKAECGLEVKCPSAPVHVAHMKLAASNQVDDSYRLQIQGGLWTTKLPYWDFFSFYPGMPAVRVTVYPELVVQRALDEHMPAFFDQLESGKAMLRDMGVVPALELAA